MQLRDAVEQYADMLMMGAQALERMADKVGGPNSEVGEILDNIRKEAERLRAAAPKLDAS